jgi:hypothetical protein
MLCVPVSLGLIHFCCGEADGLAAGKGVVVAQSREKRASN